MMIDGYYYLHENSRDLIYKRELGGTAADIRESPFAIGLWPCDPTNRLHAWNIVVEGLAAGARPERVKELATLWQCTDEDAQIYAGVIGADIMMDGDQWCATNKIGFKNLQESPAGFGAHAYEALADLCKNLGYKPSKMWGASFKDLLAKESDDENQ